MAKCKNRWEPSQAQSNPVQDKLAERRQQRADKKAVADAIGRKHKK